MRAYKWTGEQRMLPGVGEPKPGDVVQIDEDRGASLVAQGLCEEVVTSKTATKEKE